MGGGRRREVTWEVGDSRGGGRGRKGRANLAPTAIPEFRRLHVACNKR